MSTIPEQEPDNGQTPQEPLSPWQEAVLRSADVFYVGDPDGYLKREAPPTEKERKDRNKAVISENTNARLLAERSLN